MLPFMLPFACFTPSHGFLDSLFLLPGYNAIYLPIDSDFTERALNMALITIPYSKPYFTNKLNFIA
jgi:hypothetical protein